MRFLKFFIVILIIFNFNLAHANTKSLNEKITKNLRCLVCQGQSVYDSDSEFAISLRVLINKKLNQGSSEKEIYDYLKDKYGDWILYDPGFGKNTYFLWILSLLMFLLGCAIILKLFIYKKN